MGTLLPYRVSQQNIEINYKRIKKRPHYVSFYHFVAQRVRAVFPKLPATFFGTGDLFSCLTLIYFEKYRDDPNMKVC